MKSEKLLLVEINPPGGTVELGVVAPKGVPFGGDEEELMANSQKLRSSSALLKVGLIPVVAILTWGMGDWGLAAPTEEDPERSEQPSSPMKERVRALLEFERIRRGSEVTPEPEKQLVFAINAGEVIWI